MKRALKNSVVTLAIVVAAGACGGSPRSPLVGSWRMTQLQVGTDPAAMQTVPYGGQIVFTDGGTMSVQAMNPDANAGPTPYTVNGYEAFYGPVSINDAAGTFVVTVEASLVRGLIGQKLERRFEVNDDRLVLTPADPREGFRVTYRRD